MKHGSATTQLEAGRVAEAHKDGHEILPIVAPDALHVESGVFDAPVVDAPLPTTTSPQEFDEWEGTEEDDVSQMVGVLSVQDAAQDAVFDGTGCDGGEPTDDAGAFWAWAMARTVERAMRENWTQDDMDAAYLQASLVSYQSHDSYPVIYGQGYVESDPEHYTSNCPWNDWTPPSESERLFREANSAKRPLDGVSSRIRVRLIPMGCPGNGLIAFVSAEVDDDGKAVLVFRRGADVLVTLFMRYIRLLRETANPRRVTIVVQACHGIDSRMILRFDSDKRVQAFEALLGPNRSIDYSR